MSDQGSEIEALLEQAAQIRSSGALGRSARIIALFDYLVAEAAAGKTPKGVEIAHHVFSKDPLPDAAADAMVRIEVYRLRQKIAVYYKEAGSEQPLQLVLPKGEYRFRLTDAEPGERIDEISQQFSLASTGGWAVRFQIAAAICALLVIGSAIGWGARSIWMNPAPAADMSPWREFNGDIRPRLIVLGDYYLFGEVGRFGDITNLRRDFGINSREELAASIMEDPSRDGRIVDLDLRYVPTSAAVALRNILPLVKPSVLGRDGKAAIIMASQVTPDLLKSADLIYVGYLSGLGPLRDAVFAESAFKVGGSYDEIIHKRTGKSYTTDAAVAIEGHVPRQDLAYLAAFTGPVGNHIVIVAGARDAGTIQAAEILADPEQLNALARRSGASSRFEALYSVRVVQDMNVGKALRAVEAIGSKMWWRDASPQAFPDTNPDGE